MRGMGLMLRRFMSRSPCVAAGENLILSSTAAASCSALILADDSIRPLFLSSMATGSATVSQGIFLNHSRSFSSPPSADPSKVVLIESEEHFNDSIRKVQGRLLSPVIGQLSEKYPHVTTYKIDIDKEGLGNALSKLNIHSVPTLHFFQDGKKASEVIGADVQSLKDTMEALYK